MRELLKVRPVNLELWKSEKVKRAGVWEELDEPENTSGCRRLRELAMRLVEHMRDGVRASGLTSHAHVAAERELLREGCCPRRLAEIHSFAMRLHVPTYAQVREGRLTTREFYLAWRDEITRTRRAQYAGALRDGMWIET